MQFPQLFLGTILGTFPKFARNKCAQTLKNEYMKASIYLRKTKKGTDDTTLCIRIRQGKSDLRAVTPLTVITHFWDCRKQCYKANTPVTTIGKDERVSFNKKVGRLLAFVEENIQEESGCRCFERGYRPFLCRTQKAGGHANTKYTPCKQSWNG